MNGKLFEADVFDELDSIYENTITNYFLDCSASWFAGNWKQELAEIEQLEKDGKQVKVYYVSDHIFTDPKDAFKEGGSKGFADVAEYAKAHPEEKCIVRTDDDYKYQGGEELEKLANVELRLRKVEECLKEGKEDTPAFIVETIDEDTGDDNSEVFDTEDEANDWFDSEIENCKEIGGNWEIRMWSKAKDGYTKDITIEECLKEAKDNKIKLFGHDLPNTLLDNNEWIIVDEKDKELAIELDKKVGELFKAQVDKGEVDADFYNVEEFEKLADEAGLAWKFGATNLQTENLKEAARQKERFVATAYGDGAEGDIYYIGYDKDEAIDKLCEVWDNYDGGDLEDLDIHPVVVRYLGNNVAAFDKLAAEFSTSGKIASWDPSLADTEDWDEWEGVFEYGQFGESLKEETGIQSALDQFAANLE